MNEPQASPTPQTDALVLAADGCKSVHPGEEFGPNPDWKFEPEIVEIIDHARRLERQRDVLIAALEGCLKDIEALMHDTYGDTVILPLSHDRGSAALAEVGKGES